MIRRLAIGLALSLAPFAAAHAEFVEQPFAPQVGSRWTIEDVQEAVSTGPDGARNTQTIGQTSEVVFEDKLADGWRVSFVVKNISIRGDAPGVAVVGPAIESMKGVAFSAATDRRGKPIEVLNLVETRERMTAVVEKASAGFADKPQVAKAMRSLLTNLLLLDGRQAAESYLEPLNLMAVAQGTGLKPGEARRETLQKPNPLGGDAIRSVTVTRIAEPDPDGVTIVTQTEAYDPESLKQSIAVVGRKLLGSVGPEAAVSQADLDRVLPMITVSYDALSVFDVKDGMAREVTQSSQTRVSAMGKAFAKEEKRRMTFAPAP